MQLGKTDKVPQKAFLWSRQSDAVESTLALMPRDITHDMKLQAFLQEKQNNNNNNNDNNVTNWHPVTQLCQP